MVNFDSNIGYTPGIIGRVTEMHAKYYSDQWRFGSFFEAKVASGLSDFINHCHPSKDRIWSLTQDGTIEGSITINGSSEQENIAHLRWFIVSDTLRGKGAGNFLMDQAMSFSRDAGFERIYLWTFQGLEPARHLYEKFGFELKASHPGAKWGTTVTEQRFESNLRG